MAFSPGTRFGSFEILSLLGAGGMGEVYRARDARLNRDVALKVLPEAFTSDPERLARFTREAQTLAALNHSNIGGIHGLEDANGRQALVLELVEGPTLADRIAAGALPVAEALPIARQIADALEAAHEQGIVHRDLKPANIKLRPDGTVKVLDFGLAKALSRNEGNATSRVDVTASPTMLSPATMTSAGLILGTAAYMAPEQARGKPVDRRADIWGFGCVLYEMLAGRRTFEGDEVTDTLAGILRGEPSWDALPATTPRSIQRLLRRCLQKDPRERLQAIGDARLEIAEAALSPADEPAALASSSSMASRLLPAAAASVVTALVVGAAAWTLKPAPAHEESRVTRSLIGVNPFDQRPAAQPGMNTGPLGRPDRTAIALSPDGRTLVFRGSGFNISPDGRNQTALFIRPLDSLAARPIVTTTGADSPFFSPDGSSIGYIDNGELRRVPATAGDVTATTVTPLPNRRQRIDGASWADQGFIVFATVDGLWRVAASGGTPERIVEAGDNELGRVLPQVLPGSQWVLFTVARTAFRWDDAQIVARSLVTGEEKVLLTDAADARYASSGHLVFLRRGKLMAVPFDANRVALRGAPVSVVDDVMQAINMPNTIADSGAGQFAIAAAGTLVYVTGGPQPTQPGELVWVDRAGNIEPVGVPHGPFGAPRLSPDGRRIVMMSGAAASDGNRVWVYDIERRTHTALTARDERVAWGLWSPDGSRVVFARLGEGKGTLYARSADGTGGAEPIVEARPAFQTPSSWAKTGTLAFVENAEGTGTDIRVLEVGAGDRKGSVVVQTPAEEAHPAFSPEGNWLAYVSAVSGRSEVYVQAYPGPGPRILISTGGGTAPAWRGDGRELYYHFVQDGALRLMAVPITVSGSALTAGAPRQLFEAKGLSTTGPARGYDVTADGQRFLFVREVSVPPPAPPPMVLVDNWFQELKRLAPASTR
jgi:eukaryotic-like serine/threonine-protein kinase